MRLSSNDLIERELEPGEHLLWSGAPPDMIDWDTWPVMLLGSVWAGAAGALAIQVMSYAAIIPLLMTLFWCCVVIDWLVLDPLERRNVAYGVTDDRILIVRGLVRRSVKSLPRHSLTEKSLLHVDHGDRRETIESCEFEGGEPANRTGIANLVPIPDVLQVQKLIEDARSARVLQLSKSKRSSCDAIAHGETELRTEKPRKSSLTDREIGHFVEALFLLIAVRIAVETFDNRFEDALQAAENREPNDPVFWWVYPVCFVAWLLLFIIGLGFRNRHPMLIQRGSKVARLLPLLWLFLWFVVFRPRS